MIQLEGGVVVDLQQALAALAVSQECVEPEGEALFLDLTEVGWARGSSC